MKHYIYIIIAIAGVAAAVMNIIVMDSVVSFTTLGFIAWALSPYVYMVILVKVVTARRAFIAVMLAAIVVGGFGTLAFVDILFINPDAQGGLVFVVTPLWQWALLIISTL
ncbi:hypothetical protein MNBD_GAMMA12-1489, partial [hydrothermal vent metagenome]